METKERSHTTQQFRTYPQCVYHGKSKLLIKSENISYHWSSNVDRLEIHIDFIFEFNFEIHFCSQYQQLWAKFSFILIWTDFFFILHHIIRKFNMTIQLCIKYSLEYMPWIQTLFVKNQIWKQQLRIMYVILKAYRYERRARSVLRYLGKSVADKIEFGKYH